MEKFNELSIQDLKSELEKNPNYEKCKISNNIFIYIYTVNIPSEKGSLYNLKTDKSNKNELVKYKLQSKKNLSRDVILFTFEIPNEDILGISTGNHIAIK